MKVITGTVYQTHSGKTFLNKDEARSVDKHEMLEDLVKSLNWGNNDFQREVLEWLEDNFDQICDGLGRVERDHG